MKKLLLTGGCGYIGSHACVEFLQKGYKVVIYDNLSNSSEDTVGLIEQITGKTVKFIHGDLLDYPLLDKTFKNGKFDAVIHFAGLKAVGESVKEPLKYYENNIGGTINLLKSMLKYGVKKIIFSSSATVYGNPKSLPIYEDFPLAPTNPYGETKLVIENMLVDTCRSQKDFIAVILRYFNPVGAHSSGLIGERPNGIPNNLAPYIAQVVSRTLPKLRIFGDDYDTPDGTGIRDYIHITDLALGHVAALEKVGTAGVHVFNLGTGKGTSVLELVHAYECACGKKIPYEIAPRRDGDIAECYANCDKAKQILGWNTKLNIDDMCRSMNKFWLNQKKK